MIIMVFDPGDSLAKGIRIIDDQGSPIELDAPARRIIALYGAYNEILAAMGLEDRLVGRTKADSLPPSIRTKPGIGTHMRPNIESILSLKPDLIIQSAGRRDAMMIVQQLRNEGLCIAVFHPTGFKGLFTVIKKLGILTGAEASAEKLAASMQTRLKIVDDRLRGISYRPKVFFEVRYPNLLGAGAGSIVHHIIKRSGGVNCVRIQKKLVRIGIEALIKMDPEVYIIQQGPMNKAPSAPSMRPHFQALGPVRNGRVLFVDEQAYSRPGPRSVEAVEELAIFLHPARFQNPLNNKAMGGDK